MCRYLDPRDPRACREHRNDVGPYTDDGLCAECEAPLDEWGKCSRRCWQDEQF